MASPSSQTSITQQIAIFSRYFIKGAPVALVSKLYSEAVAGHKLQPSDTKLLRFMARHRWSVALIDAGLVFTNPHAEVRRRMYVMFAILESMPEYTTHFLARKRGPFYLLFAGFTGIRAICRAIFGIVLVKVIAR